MRHALPLFVLIAFVLLAVPRADEDEEEAERRRPDRPDQAAEFRYRQRLGADGSMPADGLWQAKLARDALIAGPARAGVTPGAWRWLGPGNVGGRLRAILVHP